MLALSPQPKGDDIMTISLTSIASILVIAGVLSGAVIVFWKGMLAATAEGWKALAEQRGKSIEDLTTKCDKNTADFIELKTINANFRQRNEDLEKRNDELVACNITLISENNEATRENIELRNKIKHQDEVIDRLTVRLDAFERKEAERGI